MRPVLAFFVAGLLLVPRLSAAQSAASSGWSSRVYIDVNIFGSAQSVAANRQFTGKSLVFSEIQTTEVSYPKPTQETVFPLLDLGGGVRFGRWFSAGVMFSRASFEDAAGMSISVPHPFYLNSPGRATEQSASLKRTEDFTHIFIAVSAYHKDKCEWRIYGGPSYVSYSAEMIEAVNYTQEATAASPSNVVTISGYDSATVKAHTIGWHAGTDFSYDLAKMIAVVGGVRYSEATVTVKPEPLSQLPQDIRVGTTRIFAGVRFQFGR